MANSIKTLEQGRAEFAYKCAEKAGSESFKKEYKSYTKKVPTLIKTNGLGPTIAFMFSKKIGDKNSNKAYKRLYDDITKWMKEEPKGIIRDKLNSERELAKVIIELDSKTYRLVEIEILAFLSWLRRFAEGMIEGEAEE